ncbi:MAG: phycobiliprotein lyase [Phormidesmis sp.]
MSAISIFYEFFNVCTGQWNSDRTYHYLNPDSVERSNTQFGATQLNAQQKAKVLADNHYSDEPRDLSSCPGLNFNFHTISETGEIVEQTMNLVFVPASQASQVSPPSLVSPPSQATPPSHPPLFSKAIICAIALTKSNGPCWPTFASIVSPVSCS